MNKLIALESAAEQCSVALIKEQALFFKESDEPRAHAQNMLPMVEALLSDNKLVLSDLDAVVFDCGPGSFTGLRICFSVAQGLAFAAKLPLVPIGSLEVLAFQKLVMLEQDAVCLSVLDARMGELYWGIYGVNSTGGRGIVCLEKPQLTPVKELKSQLPTILERFSDRNLVFAGAGCELVDCSTDLHFPHASALAELGRERLKQGGQFSPESAELDYLRNSVSWNKRKKIRSGD